MPPQPERACPSCAEPLPAAAERCAQCGDLVERCPGCGQPVALDAEACEACGHAFVPVADRVAARCASCGHARARVLLRGRNLFGQLVPRSASCLGCRRELRVGRTHPATIALAIGALILLALAITRP